MKYSSFLVKNFVFRNTKQMLDRAEPRINIITFREMQQRGDRL